MLSKSLTCCAGTSFYFVFFFSSPFSLVGVCICVCIHSHNYTIVVQWPIQNYYYCSRMFSPFLLYFFLFFLLPWCVYSYYPIAIRENSGSYIKKRSYLVQVHSSLNFGWVYSFCIVIVMCHVMSRQHFRSF